MFGVIQRLDPEAVAPQEQLLASHIPNREREHAAEVIDEMLAVILVEMDQAFGIRAGAEHVAAAFECVTQLSVVVDLAVEDDPDAAIFIRDRLAPGVETDDA